MKRGIPKGYKFGPRKMMHGAARAGRITPEYRSWAAMLDRCTCPSNVGWKNYGGRGIKICERWRASFAAFLEDMGPRPAGQSLERIDVNGNYEPGNVRWATALEQHQNRRNNVYLTLNAETLTAAAWGRRLGCTTSALLRRRAKGWSDERVLTTPMTPPGERR